ncbi:RNA-directed DNA polymerase, partial [bacterium]
SYHRGASFVDHYHRFQIPKKRGGLRNVSAPKTKLRRAQNWVLANILTPLPVHEAAVAFRPGISTAQNAARHAGKEVVVRLDLKDFFPSISFTRVKRLFQSFGYNEGCATVFALLCTEAPRVELALDGQKRHVAVGDRVLPQGACTSPAITNLLCRRLDARLTGVAAKEGFTYSRYADDLIFSSDTKRADVGWIFTFAQRIVTDEKFVVNAEKTMVMKPQNRQSVTGLVVNSQDGLGPRVSRDDLRKFRAFLHGYEIKGREAMTEKIGQDALHYAKGYLAYINMSDPAKAAKLRAAHSFLGS